MDKLIEEMLPYEWQRDIAQKIIEHPDDEITMIIPKQHGRTQIYKWYEEYKKLEATND